MIRTLVPYGSINEESIQSIFIKESITGNEHYCTTKGGNFYKIAYSEFLKLVEKGIKYADQAKRR